MDDPLIERAGNNGHVYSWITDRQPTALDANAAGAVRIRKYPNGSSSAAVHWSFIGTSVPWQHCHDWVPHHADEEELLPYHVDESGNTWRQNGDSWELLESVAPVTSVAPITRAIAISRAFGPHGQHYLDVVLDDGTAWYCQPSSHGSALNWYQHSLPGSSHD